MVMSRVLELSGSRFVLVLARGRQDLTVLLEAVAKGAPPRSDRLQPPFGAAGRHVNVGSDPLQMTFSALRCIAAQQAPARPGTSTDR